MLSLSVLQQGLIQMATSPSSDVSSAAQRFASVLQSWAMGATAMGIPAVLPPMGAVIAGFSAGEKLSSILSKFWPLVVFPGMIAPPSGPAMIDPLTVVSSDALGPAAILSTAMQSNAMMQIVMFMVGPTPTPFPIV